MSPLVTADLVEQRDRSEDTDALPLTELQQVSVARDDHVYLTFGCRFQDPVVGRILLDHGDGLPRSDDEREPTSVGSLL